MEVDSSTEMAVENRAGWNIPKIEESNSGIEASATGMKRYTVTDHEIISRLEKEQKTSTV